MKHTRLLLIIFFLPLIQSACGPPDDPVPSNTELPVETFPDEPYPGSDQAPETASGYPAPGDLLDTVLSPVEGGENTGQPLTPTTVEFNGTLAFNSQEGGGNLQVQLLNGAHGAITGLNVGPGQSYEPAWFPDCEELLFTKEDNVAGDLYRYFITNKTFEPFLAELTGDALEWSASIAPTGERVAYQTDIGARFNVCFADDRGQDLGCLERENYDNAHPDFSPSGEFLAFISNRDGDWEIYLEQSDDNSRIEKLTDNRFVELHPQFSPDGQYIVFESNEYGTLDVFRMKLDGSQRTRVTKLSEDEKEPTWIGNDLIAFSGDQYGDFDLFVVNADGSDLRRLTDFEGDEGSPAWCTRGETE